MSMFPIKKLPLNRGCNRFLIAIMSLLLLVLHLLGSFTQTIYADSENMHVYDDANLLSQDEIDTLEVSSLDLEQRFGTFVYILTDNDSNGLSRKRYMEDFFDNQSETDAVLIFVNMEPDNRGVEIQGYGSGEYYINNSRIEYILDIITPRLSDGDYYGAFVGFLEEVEYYYEKPAEEDLTTHAPDTDYAESDKYYEYDQHPNNSKSSSNSMQKVVQRLVISLVIGLVIVIIMAYNSAGRVTVNNHTYLDERNSRIVDRRDDYIRTTVTKTKKPDDTHHNNHSSGGGGGVSSGGSSHSGGGRSF